MLANHHTNMLACQMGAPHLVARATSAHKCLGKPHGWGIGKKVQAYVPPDPLTQQKAVWLLATFSYCVSFPVYAAGKAATSGVPSIYAPSTYAHLSPAKTPPPPAMIPMGPIYNGYPGDFDRNSSGEAWGSQEQLGRG